MADTAALLEYSVPWSGVVISLVSSVFHVLTCLGLMGVLVHELVSPSAGLAPSSRSLLYMTALLPLVPMLIVVGSSARELSRMAGSASALSLSCEYIYWVSSVMPPLFGLPFSLQLIRTSAMFEPSLRSRFRWLMRPMSIVYVCLGGLVVHLIIAGASKERIATVEPTVRCLLFGDAFFFIGSMMVYSGVFAYAFLIVIKSGMVSDVMEFRRKLGGLMAVWTVFSMVTLVVTVWMTFEPRGPLAKWTWTTFPIDELYSIGFVLTLLVTTIIPLVRRASMMDKHSTRAASSAVTDILDDHGTDDHFRAGAVSFRMRREGQPPADQHAAIVGPHAAPAVAKLARAYGISGTRAQGVLRNIGLQAPPPSDGSAPSTASWSLKSILRHAPAAILFRELARRSLCPEVVDFYFAVSDYRCVARTFAARTRAIASLLRAAAAETDRGEDRTTEDAQVTVEGDEADGHVASNDAQETLIAAEAAGAAVSAAAAAAAAHDAARSEAPPLARRTGSALVEAIPAATLADAARRGCLVLEPSRSMRSQTVQLFNVLKSHCFPSTTPGAPVEQPPPIGASTSIAARLGMSGNNGVAGSPSHDDGGDSGPNSTTSVWASRVGMLQEGTTEAAEGVFISRRPPSPTPEAAVHVTTGSLPSPLDPAVSFSMHVDWGPIAHMGWKIYRTYIQQGALMEVNASHPQRTAVEKAMRAILRLDVGKSRSRRGNRVAPEAFTVIAPETSRVGGSSLVSAGVAAGSASTSSLEDAADAMSKMAHVFDPVVKETLQIMATALYPFLLRSPLMARLRALGSIVNTRLQSHDSTDTLGGGSA